MGGWVDEKKKKQERVEQSLNSFHPPTHPPYLPSRPAIKGRCTRKLFSLWEPGTTRRQPFSMPCWLSR